jgi:hypothetical protein
VSLKRGVEYPKVIVVPNTYNGKPVTRLLDSSRILLSGEPKKIVVSTGITEVYSLNSCFESVFLSESVTNIAYVDTTAFFNMANLKEIIVDENNPAFKSIDGVLYSKDGKTLIHYPSSRGVDVFVVPEFVNTIAANAFRESVVDEVVLHDGIKVIEARAFIYSKIKRIELPDITYIGEYTFDNCYNLTTIVIPDTVERLDYSAFGYCENLENIVIGSGVKSIDWRAFYSCDSLTDVYYRGTEAEWANITIGDQNEDLTNATIHCNYAGE